MWLLGLQLAWSFYYLAQPYLVYSLDIILSDNNGISAVTSLLKNNVGNFLLNYCENMITAEFILDVRIDVKFILDDIEGNWCRGTNSGWLDE